MRTRPLRSRYRVLTARRGDRPCGRDRLDRHAIGLGPAERAGAAGPAPLARYFPRQDLVVYAEFDGLDCASGCLDQDSRVPSPERDDDRRDVRAIDQPDPRSDPGKSIRRAGEWPGAGSSGDAPAPVGIRGGNQPGGGCRTAPAVSRWSSAPPRRESPGRSSTGSCEPARLPVPASSRSIGPTAGSSRFCRVLPQAAWRGGPRATTSS